MARVEAETTQETLAIIQGSHSAGQDQGDVRGFLRSHLISGYILMDFPRD